MDQREKICGYISTESASKGEEARQANLDRKSPGDLNPTQNCWQLRNL